MAGLALNTRHRRHCRDSEFVLSPFVFLASVEESSMRPFGSRMAMAVLPCTASFRIDRGECRELVEFLAMLDI